jgi:hypothetical protein
MSYQEKSLQGPKGSRQLLVYLPKLAHLRNWLIGTIKEKEQLGKNVPDYDLPL